MRNRRMRARMYGGVRGRKTKVGGNLLLFSSYSIKKLYVSILGDSIQRKAVIPTMTCKTKRGNSG